MTKLNERLTKNYENEIRDYLKYLGTKGYVLTNDSVNGDYVANYNIHNSRFYKVCEIHEYFVTLIKPNVKDYYHISLDGATLKNILYESLPFVPSAELDSFNTYEKYESLLIPEVELKDELKNLKRFSKSISYDKDNFIDPKNQANFLMSKLITFTGKCNTGTIYDKNAYFMFDKKKFTRLTSENIHKILMDGFKLKHNDLNVRDIEYHMRSTYRELFNVSTLPIRWNNNIKAKDMMDKNKKTYLKVKKVIDEFN